MRILVEAPAGDPRALQALQERRQTRQLPGVDALLQGQASVQVEADHRDRRAPHVQGGWRPVARIHVSLVIAALY
eukprot:2479806-Pyramimonas_sp.AAC.1